jgi:hypothetical protein
VPVALPVAPKQPVPEAPAVVTPPAVVPISVPTERPQTAQFPPINSAQPLVSEEGVPDHLRKLYGLMENDGISKAEVRYACEKNGYYPEGTPLENYNPAWVEEKLIANWQRIKEAIEELKPYMENIPF